MSSAGLSKARLEHLHDVMAGYVERAELPGVVWLVSRRGETHVGVSGTKAVGGHDAMARDAIFRISSMSKAVTSVAALILVEECKLRLDDPVDALLPELANRRVLKRLDGPLDDTVPANRSVTLRDVLTFRLGYGLVMEPGAPISDAMDELLGDGMPGRSAPPGPDEWMRRLGTLPLLHQPGERWMYNTGSDVLGVLVARAAGQTLDTFLHERIFEPLGMHDTGFSVGANDVGRLATSYATDPESGALSVHDEPGGQWSRPPAFPSGAGGLVSTVDDYLAFGQMMLNQGKLGRERTLSRPSVELMTTDHLTPQQKAVSGFFPGFWDNRGWGFGVSVVTRRDDVASVPGRYGWDGGFCTSWSSDPREEMVGILMTQLLFPQSLGVHADFWTSTYQAIDD
jgi:CubicO group peptidase (beta-lactamase class C family)